MRLRKIFKETIPEKSQIIYTYFDILGSLSLLVAIFGIFIAIFVKEVDATIRWTTGVLAGVAVSISWLSVRLAYKYGKLTDRVHQKNNELNILQNEFNVLSSKLKHFAEDSDNISHCLHNICHESRDLFALFFDSTHPKDSSEGKKGLHIAIERFANHFLDNTRTIYNIITKQQCAVTIKTHRLVDQESIIATYARDSISNRERSHIDKKMSGYAASQNTAFLKIISRDYDDSLYFSDDLIKEKKDNKYKNANPEWEKFYDACLVVPIRRLKQNKNGVQEYDIFGFLCVDNKGGGFDRKISKEILSMLGDNLYCIFFVYNSIL